MSGGGWRQGQHAQVQASWDECKSGKSPKETGYGHFFHALPWSGKPIYEGISTGGAGCRLVLCGSPVFNFLKNFIYFIYLFLAVLGLHCYVRAFSSCGEWGLLLAAVRGLLIAVVSLIVENRL